MLDLRTLFDNTYYLETNPDVADAVARGQFTSGLDHFNRVGKFEGRDPSPFFNTSYYLETNTDVAAKIKPGVFSAVDHFLRFGQFEGRNPNPLFDTNYYLTNNPDIATAVRQTQLTAFEHFIRTGQFENRSPSAFFNPTYYLQKYPSVTTVIQTGALKSAFEHYIRYGIYEGRLSTLPDPSENLDLARNLGTLNSTQVLNDFVGNSNPVDIYRFILNAPSVFSLSLDGLSGDADVDLIQDLNNNNQIGLDDIIASSVNQGSNSESIAPTKPLQPGTYFVRVSQVHGDTTYTLRLSINSTNQPLL
ncbi:MAG: PPC domain-containing protein [Actinomycetota bacterium]